MQEVEEVLNIQHPPFFKQAKKQKTKKKLEGQACAQERRSAALLRASSPQRM